MAASKVSSILGQIESWGDLAMAKEKTDLRADIQAAANLAGSTFGGKREIKKLESHLWEGEVVVQLATGTYGSGTGIIALTDRRLLFLKDGIMQQVSEDFPFEKISSIQWNSGLVLGKITVFVSGNKAEITNVTKQTGKAIVDAVRNRISSGSAPSEAATTSAADEIFEQISKLGALRDSGVLTAEEFDAKKTQLLARL
ncbi:PH domain-containing protein [Frondihabitans cladoniiphilus]|uniref:PH domain-containing protein n=1 Tax=Frondihabitans cladoniiphilus TaxID=715785 RepID=UPI0031EEFDEC